MTEASSLIDAARKHLGLSTSTPATRIPQFYITDLRRHLILHPSEDNFRVTFQPNVGFGTVTCLKDDCHQKISLTRRVGTNDGKADGFGSLSAYRKHLYDHSKLRSRPRPVHVKSVPKEVVKQQSLNINAKSEATSQPTTSGPETTGNARGLIHKKEKALTENVPRKRFREAESVSENIGIVPASPSAGQVTKKIKTDLLKNPLSSVTNTNFLLETPGAMANTEPQDSLQHVRATTSLRPKLLAQSSAAYVRSHDEQQCTSICDQKPSRLTAAVYGVQGALPNTHGIRPLVNEHLANIENFQASGSNHALSPTQIAFGHKIEQMSSNQPSNSKSMSTPVMNGGADLFSEDDSSDEDMPNVTGFLSRIGVAAPPPLAGNDAMDENGDYYGRGKDLFPSPRASHDDFEKFLIQAGNAEVFDGNERVEDAVKYLGLKTLFEPLPGMEVSLMAHQLIGVKWMIEKEKSDFKGGCLADEMGLGKTIQIMAMLLKNRSTNPTCKTTLIITPLSLLDQWQSEIELKTNCGITCLIYHGLSKTTSKKKLLQHDIVLTTFSTLAHEWPDFEKEMGKKKKARKNGENFIVSDDEEEMKDFTYRSEKRKQRAGLLFQVEFFRIVLDEAQNVRNRRTRISRAVTDLQATYRWCLTGTPIVNTLADAYGYIRFLKIRPWYDWEQFNNRVTRNEKKKPELAITRLHAIMSTFLLRRQKVTMMDGEVLIKLPEKEVKLVKLEFSKEERDIYKMVEARSQATFNRYLRAGTVLKNYHQVLVLLLRLRQICSHASLISEDGDAYVQPDEVDDNFQLEFSSELLRARRLVSEEFVAKIKAKYKNEVLARMETEKLSADASIEEEDCPICYDTMTEAVITACSHVFCRECIVNFINTRPANAGDAAERGCPCCREPLDIKKLFSRSAFEPTDEELRLESSMDSDIEMLSDDDQELYCGKGKAKAVMQPKRSAIPLRAQIESDGDDDMSDFIVESDEDEDEKDARRVVKQRLRKKRVNIILDSDDDTPEEKAVLFGMRKEEEISPETVKLLPRFLPSSKMKYMMNEIERLSKAKPDEKVLIVSQWTSCLTLVSNYLTEKGIPHVKYQGNMSRMQRGQAVKVFMSKEKARIMLMSLKCGGVGLNLTRANNVISLDLGWSMAVESQAFDRIHRLGQMRKVLVQRVVIADTVEDRILQLQERKKTFADGTLGEGSGKKMGKLTVKELANLFGLDAYGRVLHD